MGTDCISKYTYKDKKKPCPNFQIINSKIILNSSPSYSRIELSTNGLKRNLNYFI